MAVSLGKEGAVEEMVPEKVTVRLDRELRDQVKEAMLNSGMSCSQTVRVLISLGYAREGQLEHAFKGAAWREALNQVASAFRRNVESAVTKAINLMETKA